MAEVLGYEHDEALTLGQAVAGLNAYSKAVSLGLFQPTPREVKEQRRKMRKEETVTVDLLHHAVPAKHTDEGCEPLAEKPPFIPRACRSIWRASSAMPSKRFLIPCWSSRSLSRRLIWRKKPTPGTRNLDRRFPRARKAGEPPASWTWTSSGRWLRPEVTFVWPPPHRKREKSWVRERSNCSHNHGNIIPGGEKNEVCGSPGIQAGCSPVFK